MDGGGHGGAVVVGVDVAEGAFWWRGADFLDGAGAAGEFAELRFEGYVEVDVVFEDKGTADLVVHDCLQDVHVGSPGAYISRLVGMFFRCPGLGG